MSDNPEALQHSLFWLESALNCPAFEWDADQREAAELALSAARAALAQQAATPSGDPAALERVARWLERLPEKPHSLPYWTNGFFANDCRDAAEVARQAATPAPAGGSNQRRIIVENVRPPIPVRDFDWCATFEGYEPGDPQGEGATKQAAIDDLLSKADEPGQQRSRLIKLCQSGGIGWANGSLDRRPT